MRGIIQHCNWYQCRIRWDVKSLRHAYGCSVLFSRDNQQPLDSRPEFQREEPARTREDTQKWSCTWAHAKHYCRVTVLGLIQISRRGRRVLTDGAPKTNVSA